MANGLSLNSKSRRIHVALTQRSQRSVILLLVLTGLISGCLLRLIQLQLVQGSYHRHLVDKNRISLVPTPSDRGNILDRNGKLLAANRLARSVYLSPREETKAQWAESAATLGHILNMPREEILAKLEQVGYRAPTPVRISRDLSLSAFVALSEKHNQFPGLEIRGESNRYYPNGDLASHILGYIREATAEDLKQNPDYPMGMLVGQMGIERLANATLQGVWGGQLLEVNATGQVVRSLGTKPSQSGAPMQLTLDLELQKTAEKALAKRRGAVVVLDVKTGEVLALASGPTFDPNLFTRRISPGDWKQLQSRNQPFLNRALQGYPPGSTFKVVTAAAGIQSGKFSPDSTLATFAALNLGGHLFHEHGSGYGVIGFRDAFAYSSNTFFYQVGLAAGPEQISKWAHRLGIGTTDNMGLEGGSHGSVPTPAEKEKLYKEPWYGGDTVSMSIGQGLVQVTPLEMAVMVSAIVNGGKRVKPHLLLTQTGMPERQPTATGLDPGTIAIIKAGLIAVVQQGTASQLNDGSIPLTGGKTGTAEVPGQPDNALFVGFGPASNPQIAVAVVVENGGFGAVSAVPIAREIYKTYFKSHLKQ
ncbi:penicillin-binding protein 2 [Stenomitos frigidus]|uniref:Penicillin-binding protein 2 n=1 Tax=Stenomitos frigidus ULC18 TaxID=2107698 RepID=A0A2T1E393_9CYAN|nr:penicillin-binding protein 2 [Stenomitos frigidus]PSB27219.1 penicillin-binding protein 2 [Stenomitos frigidus ULC18]